MLDTVLLAGIIPEMLKKLLVVESVIVSRIVRMLRPAVETEPLTTAAGLQVTIPETTETIPVMALHPSSSVPAPRDPNPTVRLPPVWAAANGARRVSTNASSLFMAYLLSEAVTLTACTPASAARNIPTRHSAQAFMVETV